MVAFAHVYKSDQPIHERAKWTRDRSLVELRMDRWREKSWFNEEARNYALSKARFEEDEEEDDMWECTDLLGQGSFGTVGLWRKYDRNGKQIDLIAIKQTEIEDRERDRDGEPTYPWEALIMGKLKASGCQTIVKLRKLRIMTNATPRRWRYYMECYKLGTLQDLVTHNLKQKRTLPEGFLWQAFRDFALTAYHMERARFDKALSPPGKHPFVLHLDLKHENVLLGDPPHQSEGQRYPTLKVADWGLAELTSVEHRKKNSEEWKYYGTIIWMPPEQRRRGKYGRNWKHDIFGGPNHPFTMAHTIWQMGSNMYGLLTLQKHNIEIDTLVDKFESKEKELKKNGWSLWGKDGFKVPYYSTKLCKLVNDCLLMDPEKRPTPSELLRRCEEGLKPHYEQFRRNGYKNAETLYVGHPW